MAKDGVVGQVQLVVGQDTGSGGMLGLRMPL